MGRSALGHVVRWLCYIAVVVVLSAFALQLGRGIGDVRRGEMTPAQMLEELGDWMRGKE